MNPRSASWRPKTPSRPVARFADRVLRPAFQSVLADDDGPLLARLQIVGQQEQPVGDDVGKDIQDDFVGRPLFGLLELRGSAHWVASTSFGNRPMTSS